MSQLFLFPAAVKRDPAVEDWIQGRPDNLGKLAHRWLNVVRGCGDDVRELLHDGHPTLCVGEAAFAYVNAFTYHVSVGFFRGANLEDPARILEGTGKQMRHVKIRPGHHVFDDALIALIQAAYRDMRTRLEIS
jgi:hypothetical protein